VENREENNRAATTVTGPQSGARRIGMNVERVLGVPPRDSNPKQRQSGAGLGAQRDAILKEAELRGVDRVRQDVDRRGQKTLGGRDLNDDAAIAGTLERVQPVPVARQRRRLENVDIDQ
jgi:hypothetical protein